MRLETDTQKRITKTPRQRTSLTFGELVEGVYRTCGERRAKGLVHLALALRMIEFRGKVRFVIS